MLFVCVFCSPTKAQTWHAKLHLGTLFYQGDLSPRPFKFSLGPGNFSVGASIGLQVTKWASISGRFLTGSLSGSDAFSSEESKRIRNLSFQSRLNEYGIFTDLNINHFWKGLDKYKIRLYITLGFNIITFDPEAYYQGEWVRLQPLGTEGQMLKDNAKDKYALVNWSRPVGLILEFDLLDNIGLGLEFSPRKTYTDYLDDVSGDYADYNAMIASGNILGAKLSNRTGEYLNSDPILYPPGSQRGQAAKNDWYSYFGIHFKYSFTSKHQKQTPVNTENPSFVNQKPN